MQMRTTDTDESIQGCRMSIHYENTPMQYTEKKIGCKNENFTGKILIFFLVLLKT